MKERRGVEASCRAAPRWWGSAKGTAAYSPRDAQCAPRHRSKRVGVALARNGGDVIAFQSRCTITRITRNPARDSISALTFSPLPSRESKLQLLPHTDWRLSRHDPRDSRRDKRDREEEGVRAISESPFRSFGDVPASSGANASAAIECASLNAAGSARGRPGSPCSSEHRCERVLLPLLLPLLLPVPQVALVTAMDARVVVGAPAAEETLAVATRGVATPSPVPSASSTAVTVTGTGSGGGGGGCGSSTAAATLAAPCTPQNPVVVVASPSSNHQQPGVPVAAVPKIFSRNVNGTCKLSGKLSISRQQSKNGI